MAIWRESALKREVESLKKRIAVLEKSSCILPSFSIYHRMHGGYLPEGVEPIATVTADKVIRGIIDHLKIDVKVVPEATSPEHLVISKRSSK